VSLDPPFPLSHQGPDGRGRDPQVGNDVALNQGPDPPGIRVVGGSLIEDHCRPQEGGAKDLPGPHHPAHVGIPEENVALPQVKGVGQVLGRLDGKTGVDVDGALGPAGGPRGIDQHHRVVGLRDNGVKDVGLAGQGVVPLHIPALNPGHVNAQPRHHDHPLHRGALGKGGFGHHLHLHGPTAAVEPISGDEDPGAGVSQPGGNGPRPIAGEDGDEHRPNLGRRQQGDGGLWDHGHEDADPVLPTDPHVPQGIGQAVDGAEELAVGVGGGLAVLPLPDQGRPMGGHLVSGPLIHTVVGDVHLAVHKPAGPLHPAGIVLHLGKGGVPLDIQIRHHRLPEPGGVGRRPVH